MTFIIDLPKIKCGYLDMNTSLIEFIIIDNITMADLYNILKPENTYFDRKNFESPEEYQAALEVSTTVYVGNLSFYTTQDSIRELFSLAGKIKDIIMGIDN